MMQIFFIQLLNKLVNRDMKHLNVNKISLDKEKTELVFFKSPTKVLPCEIKMKLSGKRLYPSNSVKYLCIRFDNTVV